MTLIRKALWPTAIVATLLMLFGALGSAVNADTLGDVQSSTGDNVVEAGEEVAIYVVVEGDVTDVDEDAVAVLDAVDALAAADTAPAIILADDDLVKAVQKFFVNKDGDFEDLDEREASGEGVTPVVTEIEYNDDSGAQEDVILGDRTNNDLTDDGMVGDLRTAVIALLAAAAGADEDAPTAEQITTLIATQDAVDEDVDLLEDLPGLTATEAGVTDTNYTVEVDGNAEIIEVLTDADELTAQDSGRTRVSGISPVEVTDGEDVQEDFDLTDETSVLLVVVECTSGSFEISFESNAAGGLRESADFDCQGSVEGAEISASKSTVYSAGSANSDITVTIEDEDGSAATPGNEVVFTTNSCVFDNGKDAMDVDSESDGDETVAEATLDCSDASAGDATVAARIDKPGRDIILTTTVNVVGPPASLTVDAGSMMDGMTCGEVATLAINVVDSAGQPVANGTVVNLTTNIAGVLVAPVTTSGGVADAYLITSNANVGSYAVVAQSGSAIGYVAVSCEAAAAPAPMEEPAPAITPPSTGDAGLAETSGSSWMLLAIAGALAFVMAAVVKGTPKFFRR